MDLYGFYATAGTLVELDVDAQAVVTSNGFNGQQLDARIIVYDTHGALTTIVDDGTTVNDPRHMRDPFLDFRVGSMLPCRSGTVSGRGRSARSPC